MMPSSALPARPAAPPSLDQTMALAGDDLKRVDALIIERVSREIPLIRDIARHIVNSGGKRLRPLLTLLSAKLCGYEGNRHIALAGAVEFIHTATLLHDDVVDESKLRRGHATANEVFGNKASVLVGDFLLSQAFQLMVADGSERALEVLSSAAATIARGEVKQLMTTGNPGISEDAYMDVIACKTAALFAAACEIGAVAGGRADAEEPLRNFGQNIGIAFQLVDDALDYCADERQLGKTVGDDFREGKVTLPVILAYAAGTEEDRQFWQRTLSELRQEPGDLKRAIGLMHKYQAISGTFEQTRRFCEQAGAALKPFPASPCRAACMEIVDFCAGRMY